MSRGAGEEKEAECDVLLTGHGLWTPRKKAVQTRSYLWSYPVIPRHRPLQLGIQRFVGWEVMLFWGGFGVGWGLFGWGGVVGEFGFWGCWEGLGGVCGVWESGGDWGEVDILLVVWGFGVVGVLFRGGKLGGGGWGVGGLMVGGGSVDVGYGWGGGFGLVLGVVWCGLGVWGEMVGVLGIGRKEGVGCGWKKGGGYVERWVKVIEIGRGGWCWGGWVWLVGEGGLGCWIGMGIGVSFCVGRGLGGVWCLCLDLGVFFGVGFLGDCFWVMVCLGFYCGWVEGVGGLGFCVYLVLGGGVVVGWGFLGIFIILVGLCGGWVCYVGRMGGGVMCWVLGGGGGVVMWFVWCLVWCVGVGGGYVVWGLCWVVWFGLVRGVFLVMFFVWGWGVFFRGESGLVGWRVRGDLVLGVGLRGGVGNDRIGLLRIRGVVLGYGFVWVMWLGGVVGVWGGGVDVGFMGMEVVVGEGLWIFGGGYGGGGFMVVGKEEMRVREMEIGGREGGEGIGGGGDVGVGYDRVVGEGLKRNDGGWGGEGEGGGWGFEVVYGWVEGKGWGVREVWGVGGLGWDLEGELGFLVGGVVWCRVGGWGLLRLGGMVFDWRVCFCWWGVGGMEFGGWYFVFWEGGRGNCGMGGLGCGGWGWMVWKKIGLG
uniref:Uncharacterized protein n=1 Tax=Knipowitschia caucasica TaxID=637954 RepID=A0AAV2LR27_KNICA